MVLVPAQVWHDHFAHRFTHNNRFPAMIPALTCWSPLPLDRGAMRSFALTFMHPTEPWVEVLRQLCAADCQGPASTLTATDGTSSAARLPT